MTRPFQKEVACFFNLALGRNQHEIEFNGAPFSLDEILYHNIIYSFDYFGLLLRVPFKEFHSLNLPYHLRHWFLHQNLQIHYLTIFFHFLDENRLSNCFMTPTFLLENWYEFFIWSILSQIYFWKLLFLLNKIKKFH